MKIKNVVKVMNFHSLLKVDKARRTAEKYFSYERELTEFADNILNNRNLLLDKKVLSLNRMKKPLNIYIGNDMGFCGNLNSSVKKAERDNKCQKIIIGKKVKSNDPSIILQINKEEYANYTGQIEEILYDTIVNKNNSEINLIYNHYYNVGQIELIKKKILPLDNLKTTKTHKEDFTIEGDINEILTNVIVLYLSYEIKVAIENTYASENITRQMLTQESLKKLDEIEIEEQRKEKKAIKQKSFKKVIDNFIKLKNIEE